MITEKNIINLFLYNELFRNKVVSFIHRRLFDDVNCADILQLMLDYHTKYNAYPIDNIEVLIMNNPWKQDAEIVREKINIIHSKNINYKTDDIEIFLDQTETWFKRQSFGIILHDNIDSFMNKKDIDYTGFNNELQDIASFTFKKEKWLDVFDANGVIEDINSVEDMIQFDSSILNVASGGGIPLESLTVIIGGTHTGKTRALVSLATDIAKKNKDGAVLYLTLEIDSKKTRINLLANLLNSPHEIIKYNSNKNRQEFLENMEKIKKDYGNIYVDGFRSDTCTPALIRSYVENQIIKGNDIKAIFIDYLTLMVPNAKFNNSWEKGNNLTKEVRAISQDFKIPILTAAQPTREGAKKAQAGVDPDLYDVGESRGIVEASDFVMNIMETEDMIKQKIQRFKILKNRTKNSKTISILASYDNDIYRINFNSVNDSSIIDNDQLDINNSIIKDKVDIILNDDISTNLDII